MTDAQSNVQETVPTTSASDDNMQNKRKKFLGFFALILLIAAILYAIWALFLNHSVSTDNAYVGAETAQITSMVSGQVAQVLVKDTQTVHRGDVLVRIDDRDAKIALAQAEAELAKAKRQYKETAANSSSLNSQVVVRADEINSAKAQVAQAQADYDKAALELNRRAQLAASGAVSKEELTKAQSAVETAKAGLAQATSSRKAAESTLAANEALIQGVSETSTPDVQVAQAHVEQAQLDLERTVIRAPVDGVITRRNIQVGQRVAPGTSMMMIVPLNDLYVDANFKESQLKKVRPGQPVTLTSDLYGDDVEYHGKVVGFSGGTGSAFALIPAQNATGNWIKVVQRLPVRIALDPKELAEHPLRVGLSMEAKVDLSAK
ncbi:EmrA/EmrK family multidrug efflux transporter periplasmic adaptor subunit [Acinetobacter baumannii]